MRTLQNWCFRSSLYTRSESRSGSREAIEQLIVVRVRHNNVEHPTIFVTVIPGAVLHYIVKGQDRSDAFKVAPVLGKFKPCSRTTAQAEHDAHSLGVVVRQKHPSGLDALHTDDLLVSIQHGSARSGYHSAQDFAYTRKQLAGFGVPTAQGPNGRASPAKPLVGWAPSSEVIPLEGNPRAPEVLEDAPEAVVEQLHDLSHAIMVRRPPTSAWWLHNRFVHRR
mmetsp:Transcript_122161/g.390705  ORF Transcript_122161/g.390705 Transcript_122161/m.390705 type:complete len:222 (+) Transcript_122161:1415-2080(+)